MKYAIIAGGEGSRLAQEGVKAAKPLVEINGEKLVDRLLRVFADNGAEAVTIVYRDSMTDVAAHLKALQSDCIDGRRVPITAVEAHTPSSMHSLFAISGHLEGAPFCLTTVDTVFSETAFKGYIDCLNTAISNGTADGVMAVTDYIDDERPLYVAVDDGMNITGFLDEKAECKYVSAGIYGLKTEAIDVLRDCISKGESRMRNFQRALLRAGFRLKAFNIGKAFDIDHAADIAKAGLFLQETK